MKNNKRLFSLIMCCIMLLTSFPLLGFEDLFTPLTVSAEENVIYYGDLNENGRVEASDARLVLQKAASLITLTDRQMALADVNQDGRVTAMDARATLRIAARIETPVVFETTGTEDDTVDYLGIYSEFLRNQGKTRKIYSDMINKTNTFIYWDSAVCKLDKDSDVPNMILIYYNDNIQNDLYQPFPCYNIEIYTIKDGKVELVHSKQFVEAYCHVRFDLWRDPTTNSFELTEYNTFEGCSFSLCYPTDKELFANNWGMDNPYYAPGYEKYFTATNIITHIDKYSAYTFSNTTSDTIRISVIDDNSNVETKTFDF